MFHSGPASASAAYWARAEAFDRDVRPNLPIALHLFDCRSCGGRFLGPGGDVNCAHRRFGLCLACYRERLKR